MNATATRAHSPPPENADGGNLTLFLERTYLGMDFGNVLRNMSALGSATLSLSGHAYASAIAAAPSLGLSLVVGLLYVTTGTHGFLESYKSVEKAQKILSQEVANTSSEEEVPLLDTNPLPESKELTELNKVSKSIKLNDEEKSEKLNQRKLRNLIEKLSLYNWALFIMVGVTQIGSGIVSLLGPDTAHFLGYGAQLTASVAKTALLSLLTGIGVVYIVRGGVMMYRAHKSISLNKKLREEIQTTFSDPKNRNKDAILKFLEKNCAIKDSKVDVTAENGTTTKELKIIDMYTGRPISEIEVLSERNIDQYLQELDEGLHNAIMTQEVGWDIGCAMVLGGCLTLIAAYLSAGTSVLAISIASSVIFTGMEVTFLRYDSSDHFKAYAHKTYVQPKWLKNKGTKIYGVETYQFGAYQEELKSWAPWNWGKVFTPLARYEELKQPSLELLETH